MLFKILHGDASRISTDITPYHEGYCYVTHDGYFYVDMNNQRVKLNSEYADKLRYVKDGATVELDPSDIATKTELSSALAGKANASHNHDDKYYTETEIDNKLSGKSDTSHTHDDRYYTESEIDTKLDNKVDKVSGKGLSTNDLTGTLKGNYDKAYTHSQAAHAPAGAQANVIESVKVNGTAQTITNKSVNITVPTGALASKSKVSESDLDSTLATKLNGMTDADELEAAISAEAQRVDTALSGKANTSHSHNDVYYTETEVDTKLDNKVDKVNGKGLSTNDYTTTEKTKLAGIEAGANKYVLPSATDSVVGGMKLYTATGTNTAGTMTQKAITDALAGKSGTGHNHDSVYSKLGHTHTAAEVGATTQTYVDNQIKDAKSYTDTKVAGLVDSAPETLNTLNELAAALGDDPNFATTMATELGKKATKTELNTHASSNIHITDAERAKWDTHADSAHAPSNAERNIIVGIQKNGTDVTVGSNRKVNITVPTKTSELTNNSDFATNASVASVKDELQANIDGKADSSHGNHVPTTQTASNKVFLRNDNTWATVTPANIGAAASSHTHSYLPLSGGTIDGRLSVHGYGNNGGLNLDGYQGRLELRAEIGTASIACVDGTNSAALIFSPNKPANEGVKFSMKKDSTLSLYKLYGEHNKPTANDIGAASTMSVTTAEYNTMSANNELQETTLYMLTDDTSEEDLQATVNEMNNIDYEANLAFDVNEIV